MLCSVGNFIDNICSFLLTLFTPYILRYINNLIYSIYSIPAFLPKVESSAREAALMEKIKEKDLEKQSLLTTIDENKVQLTADLEVTRDRVNALLKADEEKVSIIAALKIENQKLFTLLVEERAAKNEALSSVDETQRSLSKANKSIKSLNNELTDSESRSVCLSICLPVCQCDSPCICVCQCVC
jgi:hypothetical protein